MNNNKFLSKEIDNEKLKSIAVYLLAFFIPLIIQIGIFIYLKIYPFGDNTYLPVDALSQYVSFLQYFRNIFMEGSSIFYSLSKSLGGEVYGLIAYYLMSPFNIISLLFKKGNMTLAYDIILILKVSACSVSMIYFLNTKKKNDFTNLIFGMMYAFSSYVVTYGFNIMWLDSVILLPIVISGIEDLTENKKMGKYIISLSLTLITNYYMGFMVCIFSTIYFVYKILLGNFKNKKELFKKIGIFVLSSICAGMISAIILIPIFESIQNGRADFSFSNFSFEKNFKILDILSKFRTNSFDLNELQNKGLPPLFCGIFANIFVIIYFLNKKIKLKEKILSIFVIAIFILSFYIKGFNLLWTMGNIPAWYIYRYAFCFVFFYIMLAQEGFGIVDFFNNSSKTKWKTNLKKMILIIVFIISTANITENAFYCMEIIKNESSLIEQGVYATQQNIYNEVVDNLKKYDNSLYRTEKLTQVTANDAISMGYNGITYSSSTYSKSLQHFLGKLGIRKQHVHAIYNGETTKTVDMLLGIKYLISYESYDNLKEYGIEYEENLHERCIRVYKNPYYIQMGYGVNNQILTTDINNKNTFELQNEILKNITGLTEDVYYEHKGNIDVKYIGLKNQSPLYTKESDDAKITYEFEAERTDNLYVYLLTQTDSISKIYANDREIKKHSTLMENEMINLGKRNIGDKIKIEIVPSGRIIIEDIFVYYENEETLKKYYEKLNDETMQLQRISDMKLQGKINIQEDNKNVLITIPYEDGWKVLVDGKEQECNKAFEALITLNLEKRRTRNYYGIYTS